MEAYITMHRLSTMTPWPLSMMDIGAGTVVLQTHANASLSSEHILMVMDISDLYHRPPNPDSHVLPGIAGGEHSRTSTPFTKPMRMILIAL
jgi:hypothetical protein